jgi:uridine kinase
MESLRVDSQSRQRAGATEHFITPKEEPLSFDQGFFYCVKAIQLLRQKNANKIIVVGLAGPSGSGKTSLAHKILSLIPKSVLIAMDNYLDSSRKIIEENYDDYRLIDFALLRKNVQELKAGLKTESPLYDFRKSGRYAYKTVAPPESKVVLVEGTYALHEEVRPSLDFKISVSGGVHFDLVKRILRDIQRTGQKPNEVMQQITDTVFPMYKAFIEPDLKYADVKIVNTFNPLSGLLNPMYTLKSHRQLSKEDVLRVLQPQEKPTVGKYYDVYLHPPEVKPIDCKDWIRIRNAGGIYSIMFSEDIKVDGFIISPRVDFTVNVSILGGLMALGYQVGAIIHRESLEFKLAPDVVLSIDTIEELGQTFVQIKSKDRQAAQQAATTLGLEGSYVPASYIELYQQKLAKGTAAPRPRL